MRAKYAIKALVYLARSEERRPIVIEQIARSQNLPHKYLEQILLEMKNLGLLKSRKGKRGGYYLARTPESIQLGFLLRMFSGSWAFSPCVGSGVITKCSECIDFAHCGLRKMMSRVRDTTAEILEGVTLANLMQVESAESDDIASTYIKKMQRLLSYQ